MDAHYRNVMEEHDNHLRSSTSSSEHAVAGSDSSGDGSGGLSFGVGNGGGSPVKKHNHMIHLHLIPHIYVPVMHPADFPETKSYHHHTPAEDAFTSQHVSVDTPSEFSVGDGTPAAQGSGSGEHQQPDDHDTGNFINGHSGETSYYAVAEDPQQMSSPQHQDHGSTMNDNFGNSIVDGVGGIGGGGGSNHDYEAPSGLTHDEPHQYQVRFGVYFFLR